MIVFIQTKLSHGVKIVLRLLVFTVIVLVFADGDGGQEDEKSQDGEKE